MANLKYKHTAYTSAQWASLNPVIVENEIVIESDTKRTKIGNGISTYNQLEYADANSIGNSLGSIKPTDAAPTPARNGNYTFSIGGNKPAWLTAEAGVTTVKAGDGVSVVYTAPSTYTYTHVGRPDIVQVRSRETSTVPASIVLDNTYNELINGNLQLEQGGLAADGSDVASSIRVRSKLLQAPFVFTLNSSYKFLAFKKYNKTTGAYVGEIIPTTLTSYTMTDISYMYRAIIARNDNGTILPTDAIVLSFTGGMERIYTTLIEETAKLDTKITNIKLGAIILEQGGLSSSGAEADSTIRVRSKYLYAPFSLALNGSYKILAFKRYNKSTLAYVDEVIPTSLTSYTTKDNTYLYRVIIARNDNGTILPTDAIVSVYSEGVDNIMNILNDKDFAIIANGDSLMSWDDPVTITSKITEVTGIPCANIAVGGEPSRYCVARAGVIPMYATGASGGNLVIPADTTPVTCEFWNEFKSARIYPRAYSGIEFIYINGTKFTIARQGTLPTDDGSGNVDMSGVTYTIQRVSAGSSVTYNYPVLIKTEASILYKNYVPLSYFGTNDGWSDANYVANTANLIARHKAVRYFYNKKDFFVVGIYPLALTQNSYNQYVQSEFIKEFGYRYIDVRQFLIDYGLSKLSITPTSTDTADIAAGRVPQSLRLSSTTHHLIPSAHLLVCEYIAERIKYFLIS